MQSFEANKVIAPLPPAEHKHTVIDFGGANIAKPMHVGHLRTTLLGDSLQKLCRFLGLKVTSDTHLGDWGTQMGMLIAEMRLNILSFYILKKISKDHFQQNHQ